MFINKQREENVTYIINLCLLSECTISGYYGENCSTPCPKNCLNSLCGVNGTCYSCLDGYSGPVCNEG